MDLDQVLLQILGGTIASLIAFVILFLAQYATKKISNRRLKAVLGFSNGVCRIVAPASRLPDWEGYIHHLDTYALAYCMSLTRTLDVETELISERKISESAEPSNEFCIAGAPSNLRTRELLQLYCPGFGLILVGDQPENFCIGKAEFPKEQGVEYCFLAKITTGFNTKIHLVFGISGLGTAGAAYYLFKKLQAAVS